MHCAGGWRTVSRTLRGFELKVGATTKPRYPARVRELVAGHPIHERIAEPMLRAQEALRAERL